MKLLNWQRNELFQELLDSGLNPSYFTEERTASDCYVIVSKDNPELRFSVMARDSRDGDNYSVSCMPSDYEVPSKTINRGGIKSWRGGDSKTCIYYFQKWVSAVKQELQAPDLWFESKKPYNFSPQLKRQLLIDLQLLN